MTTRPLIQEAILRGTATGVFTAALAVAAHGVASGVLPPGSAVALLAVVGATIGGMTGASHRAADVPVLVALLAAGQLIGHLVLTTAGHSHAGPSGASKGWLAAAAMVLAHGAAVTVGALLIAACERLCSVVASAVRVAVRSAAPPPIRSVSSPAVTSDQPLYSIRLLAASITHRGPPVSLIR